MAHSVAPELLTPEDREARAVELERQVAGEWVRFAILDNVLLFGVAGGAGLLYAWAEAISWRPYVAILVVLGTVLAGLTVYWVYRRIQPLRNEIAALRSAQ